MTSTASTVARYVEVPQYVRRCAEYRRGEHLEKRADWTRPALAMLSALGASALGTGSSWWLKGRGMKALRDPGSNISTKRMIEQAAALARQKGLKNTAFTHTRYGDFRPDKGPGMYSSVPDGLQKKFPRSVRTVQFAGNVENDPVAAAAGMHEMGHAANDQSLWRMGGDGRLLGRITAGSRRLADNPWGAGLFHLASAAGSSFLDPTGWGSWASVYGPIIAAMPMLGGEALAGYRGLRDYKNLGAGANWRGKLGLLRGFGTYALPPLLTTAGGYLARSIV